MLDQLSKADFAQKLNTVFTCFVGPDQTIDLELVELREGRSSPRQEQFALTFCGPLALPLPQHSYEFQHATLGEFSAVSGAGRQGHTGLLLRSGI